MRRATVFTAVLVMAGALVAGASGEPPPCKTCKQQAASWDWKANGYAVADSADAAKQAALAHALEHGCAEAYRYLDAKKLSCDGGCSAGQATRECKPLGETRCTGPFAMSATV